VQTSQKTRVESPVMTLSIKKIISSELFIDRRAELYLQKGEQELSDKIEEGKNVGAETNKRWE